ncbi:hypothetical protein G6010_04235 [Dietzia sp. SLG510A3-3B2-2]|nr:hypothetical protein [Dietzia sp. SLG510A3-40A3]MBB1008809.1 hypothetical protein [Dietzia sp. SLG510A3-3B2-2]
MTPDSSSSSNHAPATNERASTKGIWAATLVVATFLVCSNLAGFGTYGAVLAIPALLVLVYRHGAKVSVAFLALVMFAGLHALNFDGPFFTKQIVGPLAILMFAIGMIYTRSVGTSQPVLLAGSFGAAVYAIGNLVISLLTVGFSSTSRFQIDVWTSGETSATVHGALWIPAIGAVPFLMARTGKLALTGKAAGIAIGVLAVSYSFTSATRTPILILLLTGAICLIRFGNRKTLIPALIALTASIGALLAASRVLGIRWSESALLERLSSSDAAELGQDARFERQALFVENIWDYSDGGLLFRSSYGYVHNIVLDEIDSASILPAIFLAVFIAVTVVTAITQTRGPAGPDAINVLVFGLTVALVTSFMIEPTLEAAHISFFVFCVLAGALTGFAKTKRFSQVDGVRHGHRLA